MDKKYVLTEDQYRSIVDFVSRCMPPIPGMAFLQFWNMLQNITPLVDDKRISQEKIEKRKMQDDMEREYRKKHPEGDMPLLCEENPNEK